MRLYILAIFVSSVLLSAQSPTEVFTKAPPEVEKSLRERVDKFFELYATGKFRLAEAFVHEDSKDVFYNSSKSPLISYQTTGIKYSDQFTKAIVFTTVETDVQVPTVGKMRMKPLTTTSWKLDNGQWWWYADNAVVRQTPFGPMGGAADQGSNAALPNRVMSVADLVNQIQIDNRDVRLSGYRKSEAQASITSNMPGEVELKLEVATLPQGLTVELSKTKLARGEIAIVSFKYNPPDRWNKAPVDVPVVVVQTGITYKFNVTFDPDPEVRKMLQGR